MAGEEDGKGGSSKEKRVQKVEGEAVGEQGEGNKSGKKFVKRQKIRKTGKERE